MSQKQSQPISYRSSQVHLVLNPAAGHRTARAFTDEHVLSLLAERSVRVWETSAPGDGVRVGRELGDVLDGGEADVIVVGGDGTTHELLSGLYLPHLTGSSPAHAPQINLIPIPLGTANALYSSLHPPQPSSDPPATSPISHLLSLTSFLSPSSHSLRPLPLSLVRSANGPPHLAHIVTSMSTHALLLRASEALRPTHPGIERFKLGFAQIAGRSPRARVDILSSSSSSSPPEIYRPQKGWVPLHSRTLHGPFAYFLATHVDRLEPHFVVAPERPPEGRMNILAYRPGRAGMDVGEREKVAACLVEISRAMYAGGKHVDLVLQEGEEGEGEVEWIRAEGFRWTPEEDDEDAKVLCVDGTIVELERVGSVESRVVHWGEGEERVHVYA